jgi:hypothetical protein
MLISAPGIRATPSAQNALPAREGRLDVAMDVPVAGRVEVLGQRHPVEPDALRHAHRSSHRARVEGKVLGDLRVRVRIDSLHGMLPVHRVHHNPQARSPRGGRAIASLGPAPVSVHNIVLRPDDKAANLVLLGTAVTYSVDSWG